MPAYLVANIRVRDAAGFEEYRARVPAVIAAHGGRYLVRGGALEVVEGAPALARVVILEFPDMAALKGFYASPEYAPLLRLRLETAESEVVLVEGHAPG
ncbi:DUF1330 domain-containing protein [Falsiroseomonas sp. CW058]|uniref:DUF1330 domain-containing protein n=1 Tax=Falsiroseomonas sp. CW058 TaxID=3388664 RepID=UPI003D315407